MATWNGNTNNTLNQCGSGGYMIAVYGNAIACYHRNLTFYFNMSAYQNSNISNFRLRRYYVSGVGAGSGSLRATFAGLENMSLPVIASLSNTNSSTNETSPLAGNMLGNGAYFDFNTSIQITSPVLGFAIAGDPTQANFNILSWTHLGTAAQRMGVRATLEFTLTSNNNTPVFVEFSMTDDDGGTLGYQVNPAESGNKTVFMNATFNSSGGWVTIANTTFNVTLNGADFVLSTDTTLDQVDASTARGAITFNISYNETSTIYNVTVSALATTGESSDITPESFEYTSLTAFAVPTGDISYGSVQVNHNSSVVNMTLRNTGNTAFQPKISGSNLTSAVMNLPSTTIWYGTIPSQTIQLSNNQQTYPYTLPTFNGIANSNEFYLGWRWTVPIGTLAGFYTGTITIST